MLPELFYGRVRLDPICKLFIIIIIITHSRYLRPQGWLNNSLEQGVKVREVMGSIPTDRPARSGMRNDSRSPQLSRNSGRSCVSDIALIK